MLEGLDETILFKVTQNYVNLTDHRVPRFLVKCYFGYTCEDVSG